MKILIINIQKYKKKNKEKKGMEFAEMILQILLPPQTPEKYFLKNSWITIFGWVPIVLAINLTSLSVV